MSIQLRLILAIGLLSAMGLLCMVCFILVDARPRMEIENASTMLLTETLIKSSLQPLKDSADPRQALDRLIGELKNLRHASVRLASQTTATSAEEPEDNVEPSWLSRWKRVPLAPLLIPVEARGKPLDTIVITPRPGDELSELWEAIVRIFEWGAIVSAVTLALTWLIVDRSLAPVLALRDAMKRMEGGDFDPRVREEGPPEIKSICGSLNALAATLQKARQDNQRLTAHMILIQDLERRDLARELHDELGPYLFSIRTDGTLLGRELEKSAPDVARAQRINTNILGHVDLMQQTNRRVLEGLTPPGLSELGLGGALRAMVDMWRRNRSTVDVDLSVEGPVDTLEDTTKLTVYRIVQEGLTNAFRHSEADRIGVRVSLGRIAQDGDDKNMRYMVDVSIKDNGTGRRNSASEGFGLRAMRERVSALSGSFSISSPSGGGTLLEAHLPSSIRRPVAERR